MCECIVEPHQPGHIGTAHISIIESFCISPDK